jgi:hypothetical protein
MRTLIGMALAALVLGSGAVARAADDNTANAILDKAIKALGGEQKLKAKAFHWKTKGTLTINGADNEFTGESTAQGVDRYRSTFEGDFGGTKVKATSVVNGDKGWRHFGDNEMELDANALTNEKRNIYLQVVPLTVVPLKGKGFKVDLAREAAVVAGKPAACLLITGPDGKDFKLYFDKESGLPVKQVAKVVGFMGEEYTQETTYSGHKDFGGVKAPKKLESKRDGEKFLEAELTTFEVLDKVEANTFAKP